MEELLLLGAGVAAIAIVAPVIGSLINPEFGQSMAQSGRDFLKEGIKMSLDATEKVQTSFAEVGESWNDLVAEAKTERESSNHARPLQNIEIVPD